MKRRRRFWPSIGDTINPRLIGCLLAASLVLLTIATTLILILIYELLLL